MWPTTSHHGGGGGVNFDELVDAVVDERVLLDGLHHARLLQLKLLHRLEDVNNLLQPNPFHAVPEGTEHTRGTQAGTEGGGGGSE